MNYVIIGILIIGLIATLVINHSLSKENKGLQHALELKHYIDHSSEHNNWLELVHMRSEVSRLQADRVTNTVYAFVAVCDGEHSAGIITKAANAYEAYGHAHEITKEKYGTDDMVLNILAVWIPNINAPSEETPKEKEE